MTFLHPAQRRGRLFLNPVPTTVGGIRIVFKVLPQYLRQREETEPTKPLGPFCTDSAVYAGPALSGLRVTWFGHSSSLIEIDGMRVLVDPVWDERASPMQWTGPKRFFAPTIALEDLPPIDLNYDPEPEPEPAPRMMPRFDPADLVDDVESLLAPPVQAASTSTLAELARAVARERGLGLGNGGLTLEDITREILRALIKDWLDQNLPYMIERIVKKEIEKMVNRAEKL